MQISPSGNRSRSSRNLTKNGKTPDVLREGTKNGMNGNPSFLAERPEEIDRLENLIDLKGLADD